MNKLDVIVSIVEGETCCCFYSLMEDEEFSTLVKKVVKLPLEEATKKLINKANEIS